MGRATIAARTLDGGKGVSGAKMEEIMGLGGKGGNEGKANFRGIRSRREERGEDGPAFRGFVAGW